jgi:uncharacterized protein (DUF1015 family)
LAEFVPFRALRYREDAAGEVGAVLAPPFDVISAEQQAALHDRSPYNIVRLELGEARSDDSEESNRYTRAARTIRSWRQAGVLIEDGVPAFYVYTHRFEHEGKRYLRRSLIGRLRLEPFEAGVVLPHEETMSKPKEDRLQLLRHLKTQVSPIWILSPVALPQAGSNLLFSTETPDGQQHELAAIHERTATNRISAALREQRLYILDGHHRYETALAYREEARAAAGGWTGDEPENFVMAAITAADDPGLVLRPIHRLVRPASIPADLIERLAAYFDVDDVTPKSYDGTALLRLLARVSAAGGSGTAIGSLGLEEGRLHLLTLRDVGAARALMPERSEVWRSLDVNVLEYAVLREALGMEGGEVEYTESAERAQQEVEAGRWPLAFLLNPTRVEQMIAVADAGERMPPKSTFFYPKLATGLVLNSLEV